jgi:hypothetical protein
VKKLFGSKRSFLPLIPWSGLIDKYGINSGRNPVIRSIMDPCFGESDRLWRFLSTLVDDKSAPQLEEGPVYLPFLLLSNLLEDFGLYISNLQNLISLFSSLSESG